MEVTYDVRVYKTDTYKGEKGTIYRVRWRVGTKAWAKTFRNKAQAESHRSALLATARQGEAFLIETGLPVSWKRTTNSMSWYEFACAYVDMKWKASSAKYRYDIARALTSATPALLLDRANRPDSQKLRYALMRWGYNSRKRNESPEHVISILRWLSKNSKPVAVLANAVTLRRVLEAATSRLDGKPVAATTAKRHRGILFNAMNYAVDLGLLVSNPLNGFAWSVPKVLSQVDRRSVINPKQGRELLAAIQQQEPSGPRLVAFFGVMYYAGLRPEEAISLRKQDITFPSPPKETPGWSELHLSKVAPEVPIDWTDNGEQREQRTQLKHRANGEIRAVPCPPPLTELLRSHIAQFGVGKDGVLFRGIKSEQLPPATIRRAWIKARKAAFTTEEFESPLARRPYDLRHACLSTWLNSGVAPTQVAEWAGHTVAVLLRIYAKCLVGHDQVARNRIMEALS